MIQVDNLTKRYGPVTAIEDVSFSVDKGRIVGFLGPNGAGKSTTMRILSCFMPATGGTAKVAGYDVFTQSLEVRRRIGYLPENAPLYPDLSVASYLDFVAEIKGVGRSVRRARVADVIERCFVGDMQNRLIGKLSKGYRQRVGLAQALLGDPEVLILDEPTIGLDPRQIAEIRALIRSLAGQHTVILSTHILPEVSMVCDSVVIINHGRIVAQGTESELVQQAFPTARIELRVAGAGVDAGGALRALPGVVDVTPLAVRDGAMGFLVESSRDRDVRADLVRLVTGKGWALQELHQVGMSLEEVFIRVVAGEQESPGAVAVEGEARG
jgi:ABC-2 type transport system ATP-binding protein